MHVKSLFEKPHEYPERFFVSKEQVEWTQDYPEYTPSYYVSPIVLKQFEQFGASGWAESEQIEEISRKMVSLVGKLHFDKKGRPINPMGRTGICGRGLLGKWGPNQAADALITRKNPLTQKIEALLILRKDRKQWAIPGGMLDQGEGPLEAASRELLEETALKTSFYAENVLYQGYVDDPRNTDNAWMETTVAHLEMDFEESLSTKIQSGDDACQVAWKTVDEKLLESLYASHRSFVELIL